MSTERKILLSWVRCLLKDIEDDVALYTSLNNQDALQYAKGQISILKAVIHKLEDLTEDTEGALDDLKMLIESSS